MRISTLLPLCFWLGSAWGQAQRLTPQFSLTYAHFATRPIVDILGSSRLAGTSIGHSLLSLRGGGALVKRENTRLAIFGEVSQYFMRYQDWPSNVDTGERPGNLLDLQVRLEFSQALGKGWHLAAAVWPGLAAETSDGLPDRAWVFQGAAQVQKFFGSEERLWLGLGLSYHTLLGEPMLWPTLDVYAENKAKNFYLDIQFPFSGEVAYLPVAKLKLGLTGQISGQRFGFEGGGAETFRVNTTFGGAFLAYHIAARFWVQLEGGLLLNRTYEAYNAQDRNVLDMDPDKLEPFFLKLSFRQLLKW
ncbi:MAG: hypothetical protein HC913_20350 [Microscillaceae bacterium]|nr:hypothetical protein [Microscillaceae bacterium]